MSVSFDMPLRSEAANGGRRKIMAALAGTLRNGSAVAPLAVHYCARFCKASIREFTLNPEVLAACVSAYYRRFRPDAVWLSADTWVTAGAMGAPIGFVDDQQPMGGTGRPLVRSQADIARIPAPDFNHRSRPWVIAEAVRLVRKELGPDVCIVACFDQYPFSAACAAMGIEAAMVGAAEAPAILFELMERCADYAVEYAISLADAGADILSGGDSPASLLGAGLYRELAFPFEKLVIQRIRARAGLPISLHICGNTGHILDTMALAQADILEIDHLTDLEHVGGMVPQATTIWGNLDPVTVLAEGTPEDVSRAAERFLSTLKSSAHSRFVLSSGCTLPMHTPEANLEALFEAGRRQEQHLVMESLSHPER